VFAIDHFQCLYTASSASFYAVSRQQQESDAMSILVNRQAPDFTAPAVMPDDQINEHFKLADYRSSYVVLLFWPMDFTFVCPTEIIAHDKRYKAFQQRGVQLIGISVDSVYVHHAWRETPRDKGGIGQIQFPMVADVRHEITRAYGIEHSDGVALRGSFLIDRQGIVQHQVVNNLSLGRDADEMLRIIDALKYCEEHGEVCPAGWHAGDAAITPDTNGIADYLGKHATEL
jgi:peroxiredoxin (alkyl hydroperoxide reductase subunit C)